MDCLCAHVYHSYSSAFQINMTDCCFPQWRLVICTGKNVLALLGPHDYQGLCKEGHMIDESLSITLNGVVVFLKKKRCTQTGIDGFLSRA